MISAIYIYYTLEENEWEGKIGHCTPEPSPDVGREKLGFLKGGCINGSRVGRLEY